MFPGRVGLVEAKGFRQEQPSLEPRAPTYVNFKIELLVKTHSTFLCVLMIGKGQIAQKDHIGRKWDKDQVVFRMHAALVPMLLQVANDSSA